MPGRLRSVSCATAAAVASVCLWTGVVVAQPCKHYYEARTYGTGEDALVETRGRAAFDALVAGLDDDKYPDSRIEAIARTRHPKVKAFLLSKLADPGSLDPNRRRRIRQACIDGLERFGDDPKVVRAFADLLNDEKANRFVRERCAGVLIRLADPAAAEGLIAFHKREGDHNWPMANLAAQALGAICGPETNPYLKQALGNYRRAYMPWYGHIAEQAGLRGCTDLVPVLAGAAEYGTKGSTVVPDVYRALGRLGDRRAVDALRAAVLKLKHWRRYEAAVALGRIGDPRALPDLKAAFEKIDDASGHRAYLNQAAIAYAQVRLGDRQAWSVLERLAKSEDPVERMVGLLFSMLATGKGPKADALAVQMVDRVRPYKDIGGCPRYPFEHMANALLELGTPKSIALLQEVAGWEKAGRFPYYAKQILARMPAERQVPQLLARIQTGDWAARNQAARALEDLVRDPYPHFRRLLRTGDTRARLIALRRLGLFYPKRAAKLIARAVKDPAWQVADEARRFVAKAKGQPAYPLKMPRPKDIGHDDLIAYKPGLMPPGGIMPKVDPRAYAKQTHPLDRAPVRRLVEGPDGGIWAATQYGLMHYDGMQWKHLGVADGLCADSVYDVVLLAGRPVAATRDGLSMPEGKGGFSCLKTEDPIFRLALGGRVVYAGTGQGVWRLKGRRLVALGGKGGPTGPIGALAVQADGTVWAATLPLEREPAAGQAWPAPVYRFSKRTWTAVAEPFIHYNGRLKSGVGHTPGPINVRDLSLGPRGRLYLATSYGVFRTDGKQFEALNRGPGYWPWFSATALAVADDGRVAAGYQGFIDVQRNGRFARLTFQEQPDRDPPFPVGTPPVSLLYTSRGELWFAGQYPISLPGQPAATVLRKPVQDKQRRALAPDTLVAAISGGAFRAENPDTDLSPPDKVRKFEGGKIVRVPSQTVTISAIAKDPWDYGPVQYRFKIDEEKWTPWSADSGLVSQKILDEGIHRIQVQSRDADRHVDPTPAEVRFSVHTKEVTVIKIRDGQFQRIFPAQYLRYQKVGLGRVRLKNTRDKPVKVNLELKIEDLFERPAATQVELAAGEERWVDVAAPFSDKVLANEGRRQVQAVVEAHYSWNAVERSTRKAFSVELLDANAFVWDEPERLAAFINGHDPLVQKLAADLYRSFAAQHPEQAKGAHPLRNYLLALYTFNALTELGVQYKPDPARPFSSLKAGVIDTVQYPSQTLARKTGDCDDLTVLFASVLENLNVPTAVLPVEGHVFMMFDSGVRAENRGAFPVDARKTVTRGGSLWVPVETTVLGKSKKFEVAWSRGSENYHGKYRPGPEQAVAVRAAWRQSPPATRPLGPSDTFQAPALASAEAQTKSLLEGYGAKIEKLAGAGDKDPAALIRRGAVLAKSGLFDQAAAAYQKAAAMKDSFAARYGLGAANAGKGEVLMALVEFKKALGLAADPKQKFQGLLAIAQCYKVNGNLKKARRHLDDALALNPAAKFDKRYRALVAYLRTEADTKAAAEDETPPFFQEILSGL